MHIKDFWFQSNVQEKGKLNAKNILKINITILKSFQLKKPDISQNFVCVNDTRELPWSLTKVHFDPK